jgi:hypothetical protein
MTDAMQPSASGMRCSMTDVMKRPILNRMDPSRLTAGGPSIPAERKVLHV